VVVMLFAASLWSLIKNWPIVTNMALWKKKAMSNNNKNNNRHLFFWIPKHWKIVIWCFNQNMVYGYGPQNSPSFMFKNISS
jgi:hypothetical protein